MLQITWSFTQEFFLQQVDEQQLEVWGFAFDWVEEVSLNVYCTKDKKHHLIFLYFKKNGSAKIVNNIKTNTFLLTVVYSSPV